MRNGEHISHQFQFVLLMDHLPITDVYLTAPVAQHMCVRSYAVVLDAATGLSAGGNSQGRSMAEKKNVPIKCRALARYIVPKRYA
jgi:hypothetical protein